MIETESHSTWENILNVLPMLEGAAWVSIASNGLHAQKARQYLRRQRPELAERLVPASDYRFGEMIVLKPVFAAVGLRNLATLRRPERTPVVPRETSPRP